MNRKAYERKKQIKTMKRRQKWNRSTKLRRNHNAAGRRESRIYHAKEKEKKMVLNFMRSQLQTKRLPKPSDMIASWKAGGGGSSELHEFLGWSRKRLTKFLKKRRDIKI